jgi:hypothetical protein
MPWGFMPSGLTLALIASCCGTQTPGLISDALGLYTQWSYTCSAEISFNLGLTFSVNDFVPRSCSSYLVPIMLMLSYIYASF